MYSCVSCSSRVFWRVLLFQIFIACRKKFIWSVTGDPFPWSGWGHVGDWADPARRTGVGAKGFPRVTPPHILRILRISFHNSTLDTFVIGWNHQRATITSKFVLGTRGLLRPPRLFLNLGLVYLFVCLFVCWYKTRQSLLGLLLWVRSKPLGSISTRAT